VSLSTPIAGNLTFWDVGVIAVTIAAAFIIARLISLYLKRTFTGKVRGKDLDLLLKIVTWAIVLVAVLLILSQLRIDLSGLLLAGGVIGIVIGIASQSVVGNLISGIFLIIERPVSIGDEVRIGDVEGSVEDIRILSTLLRTPQGIYLRMPNQQVFTSNIMNYVANVARRVDYSLGVGHGEDLEGLREVLLPVLQTSTLVLARPGPEVNLSSIAEDRLVLAIQFWTPSPLYSTARSTLLEEIQAALVKAGIEIPPPRRLLTLTAADGGRLLSAPDPVAHGGESP
jgi:small-conductance mechanosensitive channel